MEEGKTGMESEINSMTCIAMPEYFYSQQPKRPPTNQQYCCH